jgi:hypothetical protein
MCQDIGDASVDWYTRLFGRTPNSREGTRCLWEIDEHAWLFIEPNAAHAGAGRITLSVAGLDKLLECLAAHGIEHEPLETYSNGVRHVKTDERSTTPQARIAAAPGTGGSGITSGRGAHLQSQAAPERVRLAAVIWSTYPWQIKHVGAGPWLH